MARDIQPSSCPHVDHKNKVKNIKKKVIKNSESFSFYHSAIKRKKKVARTLESTYKLRQSIQILRKIEFKVLE